MQFYLLKRTISLCNSKLKDVEHAVKHILDCLMICEVANTPCSEVSYMIYYCALYASPNTMEYSTICNTVYWK